MNGVESPAEKAGNCISKIMSKELCHNADFAGLTMAASSRLLWGFVANVHAPPGCSSLRWALVQEAAGVGSTVAKLLCEAAGFDPDGWVQGVKLTPSGEEE